MSFVHLHLHTEYSLLDGLNRIPVLMNKVKEAGMSSVAMTDHGVMYGAAEFWTYAKDNGIKPIIGCEVYLAPNTRFDKKKIDGITYYHLVLLAKNKQGYINLNKLVSLGHLEGYYYRPRIDKELLTKYSEGLICTSACMGGPIGRHITRDEESKAIEWLQFLKKTFGDDFYLELQRNGFKNTDTWSPELGKNLTDYEIRGIKKQMQINSKLREFSKTYDLKLIATTDAHFLNKADRKAQEILFAIKDGLQIETDDNRKGYLDTYVKTPEEMAAHFEDLPEALANTEEIDKKVENYVLGFERVQPKYLTSIESEQGKTAQELLIEQTYEGVKTHYPALTPELKERIDYELSVIHSKGYDDYFLVVSDIFKWARSKNIVVGVRGSVAGSVVAFCLDIINLEPLSWELYFERFLNPERPSPPDIDMDFQDNRRDEVIEYVSQKYGRDCVAAICAIGRMKTKAAIRDVARVTGVDLKIADKLSKMVHVIFGKVKPINKMMVDDPEFAKIVNSDPKLLQLKDYVNSIEGMARHVSTHACGHLITPEPITNFVAVQRETSNKTEKVMTQAEGMWLEALGFMKFDFLGLRNLTIIQTTLDLIEKYHGVKLTTKEIPLDDKKTFELFGRGETTGVFQFESPPMQKYLKELAPERMEDLCFMVSAYRPGPMKYIPEYIDCRHGRKQPSYLVPEMESILKNTFGFAIYQEQVIKIAVEIGGYSMGQADLLRRAMGKKKIDVMKKEEVIFKKGVMAKGYNEKIATQIWEYLLPFADYGFNKAHGASYAVIAFWCAYLKSHYTIEFITGLMHSDISDSDRIGIDMAEARRMGFTILPPDINKSDTYFSIEKGNYIRFGLGAIKNVGMNLVTEIVAEREKNGDFKTIEDFIIRCLPFKLSRKAFECLAKIGAFDRFAYRNQILQVIDELFGNAEEILHSRQIGQVDLFGNMSDAAMAQINKIELPSLPEVSNNQKISWEKELLGSYITAHPLDQYRMVLFNGDILTVSDFIAEDAVKSGKFTLNKSVRILGMLATLKQVLTKEGNKPMGILELEDQLGKLSAVIFPKNYEKIRTQINSGNVYIWEGTINERDDKLNLIVDNVYPATESHGVSELMIDITRVTDQEKISELKKYLALYKGKDFLLKIKYGNHSNPKLLSMELKADEVLFQYLKAYQV